MKHQFRIPLLAALICYPCFVFSQRTIILREEFSTSNSFERLFTIAIPKQDFIQVDEYDVFVSTDIVDQARLFKTGDTIAFYKQAKTTILIRKKESSVSLIIAGAKFAGPTTIRDFRMMPTDVLVQNCEASKLVVANTGRQDVHASRIDTLEFLNSRSVNLGYVTSKRILIPQINLAGGRKEVSMLSITTSSLFLTGTVSDVLSMDLANIPDTIDLSFLQISDSLRLNLPNVRANNVCNISLYEANIDQIICRSYSKYRLYFPNQHQLTFEDKVYTYQKLLSNFERSGLLDSYEKLNKEFIELRMTHAGSWFGFLENWISKAWWDYGYQKQRVIWVALVLNGIFVLINFLLYKRLLFYGYRVKNFENAYNVINRTLRKKPVKYQWKKLQYVFLYTCYIFWGLKLDFTSLNIHRLWWCVILSEYVVGVVCLAYIANYIINF